MIYRNNTRRYLVPVLLLALVLFGILPFTSGASAPAAPPVALTTPSSVAGWGDNSDGQLNIPAGLSGVVAIAAGSIHSLALKSDGTVVGWGDNQFCQSTPPSCITGVRAISAGSAYSLTLQAQSCVQIGCSPQQDLL